MALLFKHTDRHSSKDQLMASRPFVTVTLPDGRIAKRQSARPYAYVVAAEPRTAEAVARNFVRLAEEREARAQELRELAVAAYSLKSRGFDRPEGSPLHELGLKAREGHYSHEAYLGGIRSGFSTHAGPEGTTKTLDEAKAWVVVPAEAYLRQHALDSAAEAEAVAANYRALAEAAKPDTDWKVLRWTSRLDLAQKETAEDRGARAAGHRLRVLPVDAS